VLFTPTAAVALPFEQHAERSYAKVIHTRGWADAFGPVSEWHRIHQCREHGVFSCDQVRFTTGVILPATDLVWVGETGNLLHLPHIHQRFINAMNRPFDPENPPRQWLLAEGAV
jgi:hypothetical protein